MDLPEPIPLSKIKVDEHFFINAAEYIRLGEEVEEAGIWCRLIKDGSAGYLAATRQVVRAKHAS